MQQSRTNRLATAIEVGTATAGTEQHRPKAAWDQALAVARRQEAKGLELRVAMSLSRLCQQQGKRTEARELARTM